MFGAAFKQLDSDVIAEAEIQRLKWLACFQRSVYWNWIFIEFQSDQTESEQQ